MLKLCTIQLKLAKAALRFSSKERAIGYLLAAQSLARTRNRSIKDKVRCAYIAQALEALHSSS